MSAAALPAALFFFAPSSASAAAAEPRLHSFEAVSLSPDGRTIATLESDENEDPSKQPLQAFLLRDAKGAARKVEILCESGHRCTPAGFAWSDDSSSLAYLLRDPRAKKRALYVLDRATLASKRVLSFDGTLESPRFMRDGKSIAVLATAGAHKEVGATQAGAPIVGEIGTSTDEQRIAVVGIGDGRLRMVSPAHLFVYEYDLAPRGFVATAAPGNGDNNWWV
ncbi:MAG: S9 family peptidase, partial [Candidatus Eremiobacteraeota bacterium]|nr:S9 family peptidase [Candidatus Eremiobacteraeota bacterium]